MFVLYIVSIKFKHLLKREKKSHKKFSFLYAYPCNQYRLMYIKLGKNLIQQQQQKIWEKTLFNINREVVDLQTQGKKKKEKKANNEGKATRRRRNCKWVASISPVNSC